MNKYDAARVLGIIGDVTRETVKIAYRRATSKYHPDRNPAGLEMMKMVNEAYSVLGDVEDFIFQQKPDTTQVDYGESLNEALNAIINLVGLNIEVCGSWVWVGGNTKIHKEALKTAKFRWGAKKKMWYFRPEEWKSMSRGKMTMEQIRDYYGSEKIETKMRRQIA